MRLRDYKDRWVIPYPVHSFRGRRPDTQRRVKVYRNLHRKSYSIMQDGVVVAHADCMMLTHCDFVVQAGGRARALREGRKNVHAFVEGFLAHSAFGASPLEPEGSKFIEARYNLGTGFFETTAFCPHSRLKSADAVLLHPGGMQTIMFYTHR